MNIKYLIKYTALAPFQLILLISLCLWTLATGRPFFSDFDEPRFSTDKYDGTNK